MSYSTKLFLDDAKELKRKIYDKYSIDFESKKMKLEEILVKVYGEKHRKLIKRKLGEIKIINYFNLYFIEKNFMYDFKEFKPIVIDSKESRFIEDSEIKIDKEKEFNNAIIENNVKELNEKFKELFLEEDIKEKEDSKIYDELVVEYIDKCKSYRDNLFDEYYNQIPFNSQMPESKIDERRNEFLKNTSMYEFVLEQLEECGIKIKKDIGVEEIESETLIFKFSNIIDNIGKDYNKVNIILVNPFIEQSEYMDDTFEFVERIVISINTNLRVLNQMEFEFDLGIEDIFERYYTDINFGALEKMAELDEMTQAIDKWIISLVAQELNNSDILIFDEKIPEEKIQKNFLLNKLFTEFKQEFLDVMITKDYEEFYKKVDKEKFDKLKMSLINYYNGRFIAFMKEEKKQDDEKEVENLKEKINSIIEEIVESKNK